MKSKDQHKPQVVSKDARRGAYVPVHLRSKDQHKPQFVSKGQYVGHIGKKTVLEVLARLLCLASSACVVPAVLCLIFGLIGAGKYWILASPVFAGIGYLCYLIGVRCMVTVYKMEPVIPQTRNTTAQLTDQESLVRASVEPLEISQKELLRAAQDRTHVPAEELLRAHHTDVGN